MKLAKDKRLWIAERRGTAVFTITGRVGRPGVPKAKELKTEEAAQAFLEKKRDEKLADGFEMLDPDAGLDAPFTLSGKPKRRELATRHARLGDYALQLVRRGFHSKDEIERFLEDEATYVLKKEREARAERTGTLSEDADHEESVLRLYGTLVDIAHRELRRLEEAEPPEPWINDRLSRAFAELNDAGIVALENPGGTPSACWSAVAEEVKRRRAAGEEPWGATFYHRQDVETAVLGEGLWLDHSTADASPDEAVTRAILDALEKHGIPAEWNGEMRRRIRILPFEWFRRPPR